MMAFLPLSSKVLINVYFPNVCEFPGKYRQRERETETENMNLCSCATKVEGSEENIVKIAGIEIFVLVGFYAAWVCS